MRVAVFHNLPPGGARRAAFEIVRETAEIYDYDFYRVAWGSKEDRLAGAQDIATAARSVFEYRPPRPDLIPSALGRVRDIRSMIALQREIARDIDRRCYDAAFIHHDLLTHTPALLRFLNTPSLYYVQEPRRTSFEYALKHRRRPASGLLGHGARWAASAFDAWLQEFDITSARAATALVANSHHSAEFIWRAYGRHPVVSYLGVDPETFRLGVGPREGLLAVGALDPVKGHDLVIEALGQLPGDVRPSLTIAFERERPGQRELLVSLASRWGVDLRLRVGIDDAELVTLYQTSAATVCAAAVEPFGLTTVESLACGTPVVALNEGGYREVVKDGLNGVLADRRPGRLAAAIGKLLADRYSWNPGALRASVLPFFTWAAAADRIRPLLEGVACGQVKSHCPAPHTVPVGSTVAPDGSAANGKSRK